MIPIEFCSEARGLVGILHEPLAGAMRETSAGAAVLLCNPFGQEAVRIHRLQRVLADQLARHGHPVLRFDYHGTGESMGDDEAFDLDGAVDDVLAADLELRAACPGAPIVWAGARLGASLAALAVGRAPAGLAPASLVLWEPILNGAAYLRELQGDHQEALATGYGAFIRSVRQQVRDQLIGYRLGTRLSEQLAGFHLPALPAGPVARLIVPPAVLSEGLPTKGLPSEGSPRGRVASPGMASAAGPDAPAAPRMSEAYARWWQDSRRDAADVTVFQHDFDWTSEEALSKALVPAAAVRLLRSRIEEPA